jgi:hypothetical protein
VKITSNTVIFEPKLTQYLLVHRSRDDKSKFLAQGGFTIDTATNLKLGEQGCVLEIYTAMGAFITVVSLPVTSVKILERAAHKPYLLTYQNLIVEYN